jgi:hypothetical protein
MKVRGSDILARIWGQRKMSQVLGTFGSLDFTMFLLDVHFETYETLIYLIFQFFSGQGKSKITETADTESTDMGA